MQGNTYTDQNQQLSCCEVIVLIVGPEQCNSLVNLLFRAGSDPVNNQTRNNIWFPKRRYDFNSSLRKIMNEMFMFLQTA